MSQVDGFEDIRDWAALHHEKLNGKGYPFGKTADEFEGREKEVFEIYSRLNRINQHKMVPIPICDIPEELMK